MLFGKTGRKLLALAIFVVVLASLWNSKSEAQQVSTIPQQPNKDNYFNLGTKNSPVIVDVIRTVEPDGTAEIQNKDREDKRISDNWLICIGVVQCLVFILQLFVFGRQAQRLRESVEEMKVATKETEKLASAAQLQADKMETHIAEATRSASAMERVAQAMTDNVATTKEISARQAYFGQTQMRAYLSVVINSGVYQERKKGLFFEAKPLIVNNGSTPAHKVTYKARAAILPFPLPDSTMLDPPEDSLKSAAVLGAHQNFIMNAIAKSPASVDGYFTEQEVELIKRGTIGQVQRNAR
jgi:hypothetical protein